MKTSFEIGDVVMLKSGGPAMTIDSIDDNGVISCIWFPCTFANGYAFEPSRDYNFSPEVLEMADDD